VPASEHRSPALGVDTRRVLRELTYGLRQRRDLA